MKMVLIRSTAERSSGDQPLEENNAMKRTRVHAQRKFAQGAALSPVNIKKDILKFSRASPVSDASPAKQSRNHSEISEVLPSKRPNTEDFLTFLCFRNTSILPARLDFFGAASVSASGKNSGSSKKSSSEGTSNKNLVPPKLGEQKKTKDKAATSKMVASKQRHGERGIVLKKKIATLKHAQRASAKNLKPVVDRRKQLKASLGTKRSLRNGIKVKKSEAAKKKVPIIGKDTAEKKESLTINKARKETKQPASVKPQTKNLMPSLKKNSLKSKARRAPLSVRRSLRSGGSSLAGSPELVLKSKRLQVIRNRKAKLGAGKQTTPPNGQTKQAKRISPPKGKSTGLDFSSEDDQPLVKKQKTKENTEKPSSSTKITEPQVSSRLVKSTKKNPSSSVETLEKETHGAKKSSGDADSSIKKSQPDETAAGRNDGLEKNKKRKPELKTQVKKENSKKIQSKAEVSSREKQMKAKPKRAVIVKKNSVIPNRITKAKLLQAKTRSHARLSLRVSNQSKKGKSTRPSSLNAEKELKKVKTDNVSSNSDRKANNPVSTRSGNPQIVKASQSNTLEKQTVNRVSKTKEGKENGDKSDEVKSSDSATNTSGSSKNVNTEKSKNTVKKEKPVLEKLKDAPQDPEKNLEQLDPVIHNTRRNSVPSVLPPQTVKSKNKSKDLPSENASTNSISPLKNVSDGKKEFVKKGQVKTNQTTVRERPESAKKTKSSTKVSTSEDSPDSQSPPSSDRSCEKKPNKSKNIKEASKKDQNSPTLSLRSREKRLSLSSDEEMFSKLAALKTVSDKSGDRTKEAKSKPVLESSSKPSKVTKKTEAHNDKLKEVQDLSESETEELEVGKSKAKCKIKAKSSVKTALKKSNSVLDISSSEDDKMEDLLNLAALKTNLSKKSNILAKEKAKNINLSKVSNLSACDKGKNTNVSKTSNLSNKDAEKNVNLGKASNLLASGEEKNINLNKKSDVTVSQKEVNIDCSKKSNVSVQDKETNQKKINTKEKSNLSVCNEGKNISNSSLSLLKANSGKLKLDTIDSCKNLVTNSIVSPKTVSKVSNLLSGAPSEISDKKVSSKSFIDKSLPGTSNSVKSDSKNDHCSPSPARTNQVKNSKSTSSLAESSETMKNSKDGDSVSKDTLKTEEKEGKKIVIESAKKGANSDKMKKNLGAVLKGVNHKVEGDILNTPLKDTMCSKAQDKDLSRGSELGGALNSLVSDECNKTTNECFQKLSLIAAKEKNNCESNLPSNQVRRPSKDEISSTKSLNIMPQTETSVVKAKESIQVNFLDTKIPHSKENNSSQPPASSLPVSHVSNLKEMNNVGEKDSTSPRNLAQVKDVNQSDEFKKTSSKKNASQISDAKQSKISDEASFFGNCSQFKDMNLSKMPAKTTSERNLSLAEDVNHLKEFNKTFCGGNVPEFKSVKQVKDCNKMASIKTMSQANEINAESNKVPTEKTTSPLKDVNLTKERNETTAKGKSPLIKAVNESPQQSHSSRMEPQFSNAGSICDQFSKSNYHSSSSPKIVNKLEGSKKQLNLTTLSKKSTSKDLSRVSKNTEHPFSRPIAEPTQEDLVAASESLIKLSMSHVPFKPNFFGQSSKANNQETMNVSNSLLPSTAHGQNYERPIPLLKNVKANTPMISSEKVSKYDLLKKCDNSVTVPNATIGEPPLFTKAMSAAKNSNKNILDASHQFKNNFSSNTSKFIDANCSLGNNLQSQHSEASQQSPLSVNSTKKTKTEHEVFSPVSTGTNNSSRLDSHSILISDQRENQLQSKKVKNVDGDAVSQSDRKSKKTNLKHDVSDKGENSKSSNLDAPEPRAKATSSNQKLNSKSSGSEIKGSSTVRPSVENNCESQEKMKNNVEENKMDEKKMIRARGRRQSVSKQINLPSKEDEGSDKKRSKSSGAMSESMSPSQRRSGRIREPSSPPTKSHSPSPPSQRVLRARKSTYFGEVDSSDEDEDFEFLIASGKFFDESEVGNSPKSGNDNSSKKEITAVDKKEEKKLVLSKRNNVAESKSNFKTSNQDKSQESLSDSGPLKKIDNKNQYVDSAKSKLEQDSGTKINFDPKQSQSNVVGFKSAVMFSDEKSKLKNEGNDNRVRTVATSRPDGCLKNTNSSRVEAPGSSGTKGPYYSHQNETFPPKTQNSVTSQRLEPTGLSSPSQTSDSKSINTQLTNFLHQTPGRPSNDTSKNVPNNSLSPKKLNVTQNPAGTASSCETKETTSHQLNVSFPNSVKETNIQADTEQKNTSAQHCSSSSNSPPNKNPETQRISNNDPSKIPNNPRTYFNRSLAAAHLKSHSIGASGNKNLFARKMNEKQVIEILKPVNKDTESADNHSRNGVDSGNVVSETKFPNTPSKEKDTSIIPSASESVSDTSSPSKEPGASSSVNLSASWKNAFKNVKLPKPFASVPKTPMDRNAWIKKHSAPLRLNKLNEQGGSKTDPFLIRSKPNDIFSAKTTNTSSPRDNRKLVNVDVRTESTSGSSKPSKGSKESLKKIENCNPKFSSTDKNIKASDLPLPLPGQLDEGSSSITNLNPTKSPERSSSAGKGIKEPVPTGKHSNLPPCIEQTSKQNSLKCSTSARKFSPTVHERDSSTSGNAGASPITSSSKQFCENPRSHKEINSPKKDSIVSSSLRDSTNSTCVPEKSPIKLAPDKFSSPNKLKNPLHVENFIKPCSSTANDSPRKRTGRQSGTGEEPVNKLMASETHSTEKSSSTKPVSPLFDKISIGAEYFPEPQSQKPTYSSNPTLKKYSQSLSTTTRKSIDSEVDINANAPGTSSTSEGTPEKVAKKVIFQQRRMSTAKEFESPKKAVAFSPEHESSVYAFEPDLPPTSTPFRRNKNKKNHDPSADSNLESDASYNNNSIAVQVNLETEAVFECSTHTDVEEEEEEEENKGQLFYIPLQQSVSAPSPQIQGVAVKLDTEGPDQRVIMRAKLVTKPPSNYAKKTTAVATNTVSSLAPLQVVSPEKRKVRPLGASSVDSSAPVGTVQPTSRSTLRDSPSPVASPKSLDHSTSSELNLPSTSATSRSPKPAKRGKKSVTQKASTTKEFPKPESPGKIVEAPTFYPTEDEFSDPLEYIERIRPMAEQYGLCRVVPPSNFKPECKVADEMRFTAYNQFVHRMLHRWGPSSKESAAIRKHLVTENITLKNPPCIGGVELDLPQLYQKVQICGGLKKVIEQDRWQRVADLMKIPKSVHDRSSKLDEIYCKYLLPYDTLSSGERSKLFADVEKEWKHHKSSENELFEDLDDCILKGRSMALNQFYRVARNIMTIHFGAAAADKEIGPDPEDVESQYWDYVSSGQNHICVHSASIDTGARGYGFPTTKNSTFAKHNWNLKILTNNSGSVLRSLGPLIGVTVPTLHVGMLFTTCCWYRDPHGLPWIEYLHTGARKIWYGIPAEYNSVFRSAMSKLLPSQKRSDQSVWLASDTAMVPPPLLVENGVSLSRVVQQPGQFIVVFPRAFTSSIATGYLLSESVYFAPSSWLQSANDIFIDLQNSCESSIFSLEQLLCSIATDSRTSLEILTQVAPLISEMRDREVALRTQLEDLGLRATERLPRNNKKKSQVDEDEDYECEVCHANLFISLVSNSFEEVNYCLCHGIELLSKKRNHLKYCKLQYAYSEEELEEIIVKLNERIEMKSQKKLTHKSSGSTPTK